LPIATPLGFAALAIVQIPVFAESDNALGWLVCSSNGQHSALVELGWRFLQ
jgi:hypothetical protein